MRSTFVGNSCGTDSGSTLVGHCGVGSGLALVEHDCGIHSKLSNYFIVVCRGANSGSTLLVRRCGPVSEQSNYLVVGHSLVEPTPKYLLRTLTSAPKSKLTTLKIIAVTPLAIEVTMKDKDNLPWWHAGQQ